MIYCGGSVYYYVQTQPRKHTLDEADYAAPTRQHELDHTDRFICPEIARSSRGNDL